MKAGAALARGEWGGRGANLVRTASGSARRRKPRPSFGCVPAPPSPPSGGDASFGSAYLDCHSTAV